MVRNLAVVIPSKTAANFKACADAVHANEPNVDVILVDDGVEFLDIPAAMRFAHVPGERPFIFSRNVNRGIAAAGDADVIVLNDDALLKTPGGFTLMQQAAEERRDIGIIGATTNLVGNQNQRPKGIGLREDPRMVCFIAVLIPRRTIDFVGLMDERFTAYGFEDDDYCLRIRRAGLKIGIHDGCYVDHGSLKSTFRGDPRSQSNLLRAGMQIFIEKWGSHPL